jgi:peptidoglycan L-alanyl-D-glutamate endopeptidase CwlK
MIKPVSKVSRSLDALTPEVRTMAKRVLKLCEAQDVDLLIYCTLRPPEVQARLFRMGRSRRAIQSAQNKLIDNGFAAIAQIIEDVGPQKGSKKVTGAVPFASWHQWGEAFDAVPMIGGKAMWSEASARTEWAVYTQAAKEAGLVTLNFEKPHAQLRSQHNALRVFGPAEIQAAIELWDSRGNP